MNAWRDALEMARFYLYVRKDHPVQGKHNALQQYAYTSMLLIGAVMVTSGIAIWKQVSLSWLTTLYGGYDEDRWSPEARNARPPSNLLPTSKKS